MEAPAGDTTLGSWRSHFQDGCFHLRIVKTLDAKVIFMFVNIREINSCLFYVS